MLLMFYGDVHDDLENMNYEQLLLQFPQNLNNVDKEMLDYIVYRIKYIDDKIFLIVLNKNEMFALLHDENVDQQNNKI